MSLGKSLINYIKENKLEFLANLIFSTLGFLIALTINNYMDERSERIAADSMMTAVIEEVRNNKIILAHSVRPYYKDNLVVAKFDVSVLESSLANPYFIEHNDMNTILPFIEYSRALKLSNGFSEVSLSMALDTSSQSPIKRELSENWLKNINYCDQLIDGILNKAKE